MTEAARTDLVTDDSKRGERDAARRMKRRSGNLKIIAGTARGRSIEAPSGRTTRPILAVLKERLFNILGQHLPDEVVWDLFAGSGSMGLEAVSRGAGQCVFLEKDRRSFGVLQANIAALGMEDATTACCADVFDWVQQPQSPQPGLIFCDPPYPLYESMPVEIHGLLENLARDHMHSATTLVVRTPAEHLWADVKGLIDSDRRVHGENTLLFLQSLPG